MPNLARQPFSPASTPINAALPPEPEERWGVFLFTVHTPQTDLLTVICGSTTDWKQRPLPAISLPAGFATAKMRYNRVLALNETASPALSAETGGLSVESERVVHGS
jgi:hypothetical protein